MNPSKAKKKLFKKLYILLFIPILFSCTTIDKCKRIEKRIARLYAKCSDLVKSDTIIGKSDTTEITIFDTIKVDNKKVVYSLDYLDSLIEANCSNDTVFINKVKVIREKIKSDCNCDKINKTIIRQIKTPLYINKPYPVEIKPDFTDIKYLWSFTKSNWGFLLILIFIGYLIRFFTERK